MKAIAKRRHTERAFQWQLATYQVVAAGGKPVDFPDYVDDDDYDPVWIEAQMSRHPWVRHVADVAEPN